jgi:hypothetical protein
VWGSVIMDVNGTVFEDLDCIQLDLDGVQWWFCVKTGVRACLTHSWAHLKSKIWGPTYA